MGELKRNKRKERIGQIFTNNEGCQAVCVDYKKRNDIYVQFLDDNKQIVHTTWSYFRKGNFHNPYIPTVYSVGSIGNISPKEHCKAYKVWRDMLNRCYKDKKPTYKDCYVCKEWLCFENFEKWFNENYYEIPNQRMNLDKDILYKNNKIYSPKTCIFVPQDVNKLILKSNKSRGNLPIGVRAMGKKYQSRCSINNGAKVLGTFNTINEAFICYKNFKENYIKEYVQKYEYIIPKETYNKLYKAICNYKVEITD